MALSLATATLIGSGVSTIGSLFGAKSAQDKASQLQSQQLELQEEELQFAKNRYDAWQSTFGSVKENLSSFYNNFDADTIAAAGLEEYEREFTRSMDNIQKNLAQRGLGDSGIAAGVEVEGQIVSASERARIRAEAPMKAAQEKMKFLSLGMGQEQSAAGGVMNTLARQTQAGQGRLNRAYNTADQATAVASQAVGGFTDAVISRFSEDPANG